MILSDDEDIDAIVSGDDNKYNISKPTDDNFKVVLKNEMESFNQNMNSNNDDTKDVVENIMKDISLIRNIKPVAVNKNRV